MTTLLSVTAVTLGPAKCVQLRHLLDVKHSLSFIDHSTGDRDPRDRLTSRTKRAASCVCYERTTRDRESRAATLCVRHNRAWSQRPARISDPISGHRATLNAVSSSVALKQGRSYGIISIIAQPLPPTPPTPPPPPRPPPTLPTHLPAELS